MSVLKRNNVKVLGSGPATMAFSHGFGCDQSMWRFVAPTFEGRYRTVLFDLVGSGGSDLASYDYTKYGALSGYADDVLEVLEARLPVPLSSSGTRSARQSECSLRFGRPSALPPTSWWDPRPRS